MRANRVQSALVLVVLCFTLIPAGAATAQGGEPVAIERDYIISVNPILAMFEWYTAELEYRIKDNATIGVGGSFFTFEDGTEGDFFYEETEYSSVNIFYRYYPNGAMNGFFFGAQLGSTSIGQKESTSLFGDSTATTTDESFSAMNAGFLIGYTRILGDAQRLSVSMGVGVNRLFGEDLDDDVSVTLPAIRLINVGIAF